MNATKRKPYDIDKRLVSKAYQLVKANAGSAGVDKETIEQFEKDLKGNLYKIWNRMSSGSYLPPPVRAVPIPKKSGGQRILGVPTVADRVAQTVVKMVIEPNLEQVFLSDSYGYRPGKSALDAVGVTRKRCWKYDWVLEFDIKGLFDNISHALLLKATRKHVQDEWAMLYIERWLIAPMQLEDGTRLERDRGTPQGGVISPVLANLFMHYVFDTWMQREHPELPWCRYADDGLVHCRTLNEAEALKAALQKQLAECELEMHPTKTSIAYCKDGNRSGLYPKTSFDFLGFTFRPRTTWNRKRQCLFTSFMPAVSGVALKSMRKTIKELRLAYHSETELEEIAQKLNPILRGWIGYYAHFCPEALKGFYWHIDHRLMLWARRKYLSFWGSRKQAWNLVGERRKAAPHLFAHWSVQLATTSA